MILRSEDDNLGSMSHRLALMEEVRPHDCRNTSDIRETFYHVIQVISRIIAFGAQLEVR